MSETISKWYVPLKFFFKILNLKNIWRGLCFCLKLPSSKIIPTQPFKVYGKLWRIFYPMTTIPDFTVYFFEENCFSLKLFLIFSFKIKSITLYPGLDPDPNPNWAKILHPDLDPNSMDSDTQHWLEKYSLSRQRWPSTRLSGTTWPTFPPRTAHRRPWSTC